ncbi:MAG: M48 family metallopeptidase, partial [Phycisphaerae bacterium]
ATVIGVWVAAFPMERMLRGDDHAIGATAGPAWRRGEYLDFNIRHHVLVVAVPMTIILFASNICDGYERELVAWLRVPWAPEMLLGIVACGVFLIAPLLLCRIWRTVPLNDGPVRTRLEAVCRRIGLRCRGILVWKSDGMVINAAVMGVAAPVRYVLLSDGLLETMSEPQIEAVFAHEAGHIRHRHLQHFLVFALVGWLFVAGFTELIARGFGAVDGAPGLSFVTIQGVGVVVTAIVWGVGFGWVSRRFERQADVFGARCVAPDAAACHMPCSVHIDDDTTLDGSGRLCATGAAIFASALDRVATLNAIPHDERSWRHSSIGSRMRFLTNLANDPQRAAQFDRLVRTIKRTLVIAAMVGCAATALYWEVLGTPVLVRMQLTGP